MIIHNPNKELFYELEEFLQINYKYVDFPISILKPFFNQKQILYNTEQLTRPSVFEYYIQEIKNNPLVFQIWDYSKANIDILKNNGIYNVEYKPIKIWKEYKKELLSYCRDEYLYDVGFCGWMASERRSKIIKELKKNFSVLVIENLFGKERDKLLSRCKIILNIHFDDSYKIFELYRCFAWLDINKIVFSENSIDNDDRCINVDYEKIVCEIEKYFVGLN